MFSRPGRKSLAIIAALLGAGVVTSCLFLHTARARREIFGRVDPASGYRYRMTLSSEWQSRVDVYRTSVRLLEHDTFTAPPPGPIWQWIDGHLLHHGIAAPAAISLASGKQGDFPHNFQIVNGYPEQLLSAQERLLSHRHLRIDGCAATAYGIEWKISGRTLHGTFLFVCVSDPAMIYMVGNCVESSQFAEMDREMQAIIASFHIEKVIPSGGKRQETRIRP